MNNILTIAFFETWLVAAVRLSGPVMLAALGETIGERTGVLNLGIEGCMLAGALTAFAVGYSVGPDPVALAMSLLVGVMLGALLALLYVSARLNQVVVGVVFNTFMLASASYTYRALYGSSATIQTVNGYGPISVPLLTDLPVVGPALFGQSPLFYFTVLLVAAASWLLFRTPFGLALRGVGEHPRAADAAGISVTRMRYVGVMCSSGLAALSGGYLMLTAINSYRDGITAGKGFIALAIVIFGGWSPWRVAAAAVVFGASDALQLSLQSAGVSIVPQLLLALPYVLTIIAVSGLLGRREQPTALLTPYVRA